MTKREKISDMIVFTGAAVLIAGICMISIPAALIIGGAALIAIGLRM